MQPRPGKTLSHYRLIEKIGEGGMGFVWRAEDTKLRRDVALKFLPEGFAKDPERLDRFKREARFLASLNVSNVAAIHEMEEADGELFLVLEYVPGISLADRLKKGSLPIQEALKVWDGNKTAASGAFEAKSDYAKRAFKRGDFEGGGGGRHENASYSHPPRWWWGVCPGVWPRPRPPFP